MILLTLRSSPSLLDTHRLAVTFLLQFSHFDDNFFIDAPPVFGGALLESLARFVRDSLDRYARHGGTSTAQYGTVLEPSQRSCVFPSNPDAQAKLRALGMFAR